MGQLFILLICVYLVLGCGRVNGPGPQGAPGIEGPTGPAGLPGSSVEGPTGPQGEAGSSCTVYKAGPKVFIACEDGSLVELKHGGGSE